MDMPSADATTPHRRIAVESTTEWRVDYYGLDGQEAYVQPLTFAEHVTRMASAVDWMSLLPPDDGDDETAATSSNARDAFADPRRFELHADASEDDVETEIEVGARAADGVEDRWAAVATKLEQSLTQLQVLADVLTIAQEGKYMHLNEALEPVIEETYALKMQGGQPLTAELERKNFALTAARRVMEAGGRLLVNNHTTLHATHLGGGDATAHTALMTKNAFLRQLSLLKKDYRLRRVAVLNEMHGDVAYSAHKHRAFHAARTFVVERSTGVGVDSSARSTGDALVVKLPEQLRRTKTVVCRVVKKWKNDGDDEGRTEVKEKRAMCLPKFASGAKCSTYAWQRRLSYAQHTLFARDVFDTLQMQITGANSVDCATRVFSDSVADDTTLHISLNDSENVLQVRLIDVDIDGHPDQKFMAKTAVADGEGSDDLVGHRCASHLTLMLQSLHVAQEQLLNSDALPHNSAARLPANPRLSAPRLHCRHMHIQSAMAIEGGSGEGMRLDDRNLLTLIRETTRHTMVVERFLAVLRDAQTTKQHDDTHVSWHWVDVSDDRSVIQLAISVRKYESVTKLRAHVTLAPITISVLIAGEFNPITYGTSVKEIQSAVDNLRVYQRIECIRGMVRQVSDRWTMVEYDVRHAQLKKKAAATSLHCRMINSAVTRSLSIHLSLDNSLPRIELAVRKTAKSAPISLDSFAKPKRVHLSKVPGLSTLDRIDHLLNALA